MLRLVDTLSLWSMLLLDFSPSASRPWWCQRAVLEIRPSRIASRRSSQPRPQSTAVDVFVFQGERQIADNRLIGNFRLDGLPPAPRAFRRLRTFDIDANGILSVSARQGDRQRAVHHH